MKKSSIFYGVAALALAVGFGVTAPASAADPDPVDLGVDWSGFYGGLHLGYGDANAGGFFDPSESPGNSIRDGMDGFVGGVHAGYNWQMDSIVFGVEGDFTVTDWTSDLTDHEAGSESLHVENDLLGSVRGRLGFAFDPVLIYATGGVSFHDFRALKTDGGGGSSNGWHELDSVGLVAGAGAEWRATQNVSLGGEFLYYFVGGTSLPADDCCSGSQTGGDVDVDPWVARVRMTYHIPN